MARPLKPGVDYFPYDTHFDDDIEFIVAKFGSKFPKYARAVVVGTVTMLWQKIYGNDGYFIKWDERAPFIYANMFDIEVDMMTELIDCCLAEDILSKEKYNQYGILTSRGIQKRYFEVTRKREKIEIQNQYLLIDVPKNVISSADNSIMGGRNPEISSHNTQSKVKESKVKKSKEDIMSGNPDDTAKKIIDYLNAKCGTNFRHDNKKVVRDITVLLNTGYSLDDFIKVIETKYADWNNDVKMKQYLRPSTLFGEKFIEYLNEPQKETSYNTRKFYDELYKI